jgi:hypothetical protein
MSKNDSLGTVLHGILASEHLDSSGERISIEGIDISSLEETGVVNTEHKSDSTTQIIGKIVEAVKILKKEDCKNKHHTYFWEKAGKTPYLYVKCVLFDKFGHTGAIDCVAMLKFDQALDTEKTKQLAGFSIEGSRLDKEGNFIKKCIARKAAFSLFPCNKACIAEILEPSVTDATKMISLADLKAAFKKAEEMETDLKKEEDLKPKYHSPLAFKLKSKAPKLKPSVGPTAGEQKEGTSVKPKNVLPTTTTPLNQKLKVGDRISSPRPKARTGRQIYNDPETWKAEVDCMSNSRKAILNKVKKSNSTANVKTKMMQSEDIDKSNSTASIKTQMMMNEDKAMKRTEVLKNMSQEAYDLFPKKEELLASIRKTRPEADENEVMAFAKTFAYVALKKQEIAFAEMADESSFNEDE